MTDPKEEQTVGRVLRASTGDFSVGCRTMEAALPAFGALVKAHSNDGGQVYGLIYDVKVEDDPFVRQLIAAGDLEEEYVQDQRERRRVPVEVSVLVVGGRTSDGRIYHRLPPQPPATLTWVSACAAEEALQFGQRLDFLRVVLGSAEAATDELAAASLRRFADAQADEQMRREYLVRAGRELARLLSRDPVRLDGILQRLR